MSKRFTDTDIWREDWFVAMPDAYMSFWFWVKDKCDHAGIYKPNKTVFERIAGKHIELTKALELFNADGKERILVLPNGKWLLTGFIPFQYGRVLNLGSKVHNSIYNQLLQNEVVLTSIRPLIEVRPGVKDKDKDKDKDIMNPIDKVKGSIEKNKELQTIIDYATAKNFGIQGSQAKNRQMAYNLLRKKDGEGKPLGVERVKELVDFAIAARGEQYAPQINDFIQLFRRFQDLLAFVEKKTKPGGRVG